MHRKSTLAAVVIAALALAGTASANVANSIQPAHVYFGTVQSGDHPVKTVTLKNRSGHTWKLTKFSIAGSGGYVFTLVKMDGTTCLLGETIKTGVSCRLAIRLHTVRNGWWRSVLRVVYTQDGQSNSAFFGSAELRAHVVGGTIVPNRTVGGMTGTLR
jgi:hypothetical protein